MKQWLFVLVCLSLLLVACGQSGALYLPKEETLAATVDHRHE